MLYNIKEGDRVRVYNIFMINTHFTKLYKNKPKTLYQMLEQISKVNKKDYKFAFKLFEQIALPLNRIDINKYIEKRDKNHIKIGDATYILNDINTHEVTKILIGASHIKVISNKNYPDIFNSLYGYDNCLYVCDFNTNDYFWLNKINFKEEIR